MRQSLPLNVMRPGQPVSARYALTAAQLPIAIDSIAFPDSPVANTGEIFTIEGALAPQLFAQACRRVVEETDAIRVALVVHNDSLAQESRDLSNYAIEQLDFTQEQQPEVAGKAWIESRFWRPIRWNGFPLFDLALLKIRHDHYVFMQRFHHVLADAAGRIQFFRRVLAIYDALRLNLAPPCSETIAIENLATHDNAYLKSERFQADLIYWKNRLDRIPDPLVDADRSKTERSKSGRPAVLSFSIDPGDFERLRRETKGIGSSLPRLILLYAYVVFSRLHGLNDLVIGFPVHNRRSEAERNSINLSMQVLPFRISFQPGVSLRTALNDIGSLLISDRDRSRFPFAELSTMLGLKGPGRGLTDLAVNYVPAPPPLSSAGLAIRYETYSGGFLSPWAIDVRETQDGRGAKVAVVFDPGLISGDVAGLAARCLQNLLGCSVGDGSQAIGKLPLVNAVDQRRLLVEFNDNAAAVPADATLASLCAQQAERTPDAIAVTCGTESISYRDLHLKAARLAARLAETGVGPEVIVGVALPRTTNLIVALLAIHKAGGAYLPLDPAYPRDRLSYMIEDSRAHLIITASALAPQIPGTGTRLLIIDDEQWNAATESSFEPVQSIAARPDNLAYIIYTSGSTGWPKGVAVEHRNAVNLVVWAISLLEPADLGGHLFSTSMNFDASIEQIFVPLACGDRIVIVENLLSLASAPAGLDIRILDGVPSTLDVLLRNGGYPRGTRVVILGGEALSRALADRLFDHDPNVRLVNVYGPTETTIDATYAVVGLDDRNEPPIGRGIWNTQLYVLDANLELLPQGAEGELYIGGAGVARGYLNKPELTAERFLNNPFGAGRLYRTGDRARWRQDGKLEFLGRADSQVKINGLRIELGEIERQLESIPGIAGAVAIVQPDAPGAGQICCYVIPQGTAGKPEDDEIRSSLGKTLPRYMIPKSVTWVENFPLMPNGKLDRAALPSPRSNKPVRRYRAPTNEIERILASIWSEVLQIPRVGVDDDFYELGGTSLQAFLIFARVSTQLAADLPITNLLTSPTVAELARRIESQSPAGHGALVPFRTAGREAPLFMVHGAWGHILFARDLANDLKSNRPVYGIQPPPLDGSRTIHRSIEAFAVEYLGEIRKIQPHGPYFLAGYSWGGHVAWEMAQMLTQEGENVALVALIDTFLDGLHDVAAEKATHRVSRHLGELRKQSFGNVLRYVSSRALKTGQAVCMRLWEEIKYLPDDLRLKLGRPVPYSRRKLYYAHILEGTSRNRRPSPYPGLVAMFNSRGLTDWQRRRWSALALGGYISREIPAPHGEMFYPPYSTLLAAEFDDVLKEIGARAVAGAAAAQ